MTRTEPEGDLAAVAPAADDRVLQAQRADEGGDVVGDGAGGEGPGRVGASGRARGCPA